VQRHDKFGRVQVTWMAQLGHAECDWGGRLRIFKKVGKGTSCEDSYSLMKK